jgi:hypothetical protein
VLGPAGGKTVSLVTEYCHYEGALARAYRIPILAVLEEGVGESVFFNRYAGDLPIRLPMQAHPTWVTENTFRDFLNGWNRRLGERKDVFLAYSGNLEGTAESIKNTLMELGATVLDWKSDFVGGRTILEQVEDAARRTSGGVFLFTRDNMLKGKGELAVPRDNVIFEAGYFAHSKGHERVLVIREQGVKCLPILAELPMKRLPIERISTTLRSVCGGSSKLQYEHACPTGAPANAPQAARR